MRLLARSRQGGRSPQGMTAHCPVAQVVEIRQALELITDERHANNVSLASIIREESP